MIIKLECDAVIAAGALGPLEYAAGWYVYAGSARAGLAQRLARHARADKKFHWHVDYFLERAVLVRTQSFELPDAASEGILRARFMEFIKKKDREFREDTCTPLRTECLLASAVGALPGAVVAAPRFGASDCRCPAHLFYFKRTPRPAF